MKEKFTEGLLYMWKNISKLVDVKSIVTISLVAVLCFITLKQLPVPDLFSNSVMLVLGFFFGKKTEASTSEVGKAPTDGE